MPSDAAHAYGQGIVGQMLSYAERRPITAERVGKIAEDAFRAGQRHQSEQCKTSDGFDFRKEAGDV
jgi:hypothetical protein